MATTTAQKFSDFVEKTKHNGPKWAVFQVMQKTLGKLFKFSDRTLIIYNADLSKLPLFTPEIEGIRFGWTKDTDRPVIPTLGDPQVTKEIIEGYFKNGSKCLGCYVNDRLVGYTWIHYKRYDFSLFDYSLPLKDNEVYAGPDFVIPDFRGNGIQPGLLTHAANMLLEDNFNIGYGSTLKDNLSSQKGIAKAGPQPMREVRVCKFMDYIMHKSITDV